MIRKGNCIGLVPSGLRVGVGRALRVIRYRRIYSRFRNFTMIEERTYVSNLLLAERVAHVDGCIVECGVWRGGMSAGLSQVLGSNREYILFDSFEGLPPATPIDGTDALDWQRNVDDATYHNNCTADETWATRAMVFAGAQSFQLVKGWFHMTLPSYHPPQPIALLRLDADWYESTMLCLQALFDHVAVGGLLIVDDYNTWDGCSRAVHQFLSNRSATERIHTFENVCFIEKRPALI